MKVYLIAEKARRQPVFIMSIAPAADMPNQEVPADWVTDDNKPVQFNLNFEFGEAEVDDAIAKYLLERGMVKRTRLLLPRLEPLDELQPTLPGFVG